MKLTTALHTAGVFITVALATFIASDPNAVSPVWKAAIIAVIAGLAAIGITPPWASHSAPVVVTPADDKIHDMLQRAVDEQKV